MKVLGRDVSRISLNALYLLAATGITALFGFLFWIVIARTHGTGTVGRATLLLAVSTLISLIGLVGLESSAVRFLSQSKEPSKYITSAAVIVGATTTVLSLLFCALIPVISPKLMFVDRHPMDILYFTVITVFTSLNTFTSVVFIAYRRTSFVLWINLAVGALKLALAFAVQYGSAITIFNIAGLAQIVNVVLSLVLLAWALDYRPTVHLDLKILLVSWRFSSSAYAGNLLNLLPGALLPIIVANELGTTKEAFFYISFTIATLLYTVPGSMTESLYAEASHDPRTLRANTKKTILLSFALLLPIVLLLGVLCPTLLGAFGPAYRTGSTSLLRAFSVSSFLVGLSLVLVVVFRVTLHLRAMVLTNLFYAVGVIGSVFVFIPAFGLIGVGVAWAFGNLVQVAVGGFFLWRDGLTTPVTTIRSEVLQT